VIRWNTRNVVYGYWRAALLAGLAILFVPTDSRADEGKLLLTGGVIELEGAGGGGLVPWALITGYETRDGVGADAHYTYANLGNYQVNAAGVAVGLFDRFEVSYVNIALSGGIAGSLNGGHTISEDVVGAKLRLFGSAVYGQNTWLPQVAVGVQYKNNRDIDHVVEALQGALGLPSTSNIPDIRSHGVDFYIAATKVFLSQSLLTDATLRFTKANQFGLAGFGCGNAAVCGSDKNSYSPQGELSAGYVLNVRTVVGAEYRTRPNNLRTLSNNLGLNHTLREDSAYDLFVAYAANKNVDLTVAYLFVNNVVGSPDSNGFYLSIKAGF
jgi:hypothetical protein